MDETIAITGATGFAGGHAISELLSRGHRLRALVREPQRARLPASVEVVQGDLFDAEALDCLLHGVLSLRALPPEQRRAWGAIFNHYIFDPDSAAADHIDPACRGILGPLTPELQRKFSALIAARLGSAKVTAT